jgi:hypothetical protein
LPIDLYTKHLSGHESIIDWKDENYEMAILGNDISFGEAERLMSEVNPKDIEHTREKLRKYGWKAVSSF